MTMLSSGATPGLGPRGSRPDAHGAAGQQDAPPPQVPRALTVKQSSPPREAAPSAALMGASKATGASASCGALRWGGGSLAFFPGLVARLGWRPPPGSVSSRPRCFHVL